MNNLVSEIAVGRSFDFPVRQSVTNSLICTFELDTSKTTKWLIWREYT